MYYGDASLISDPKRVELADLGVPALYLRNGGKRCPRHTKLTITVGKSTEHCRPQPLPAGRPGLGSGGHLLPFAITGCNKGSDALILLGNLNRCPHCPKGHHPLAMMSVSFCLKHCKVSGLPPTGRQIGSIPKLWLYVQSSERTFLF